MGITVKEAKGIAKTVTTQPLSCFRSILRQSPQDQIVGTGPISQDSPDDVGTKAPQREELDLNPIQMRDILQTVLQDERTGIRYGKYLDRQVRRQGPGEHSRPPSQIPELEVPGATFLSTLSPSLGSVFGLLFPLPLPIANGFPPVFFLAVCFV